MTAAGCGGEMGADIEAEILSDLEMKRRSDI